MINTKINTHKLRWDCDKSGCFNKILRPKLEVFADSLPGKISFGDVDGIVEINCNGLMLEWKTSLCNITKGQSIMYEHLTRFAPLTVFLIVGNAETMEITSFAKYFNGIFSGFSNSNVDIVKEKIRLWAEWARKHKPLKINIIC